MRRPLVTPVDVVTELMAGIIMALTVSVAVFTFAGQSVRPIMIATATIGCNFAWAIFDGLLYVFAQRAARAHRQLTVAKLRGAADSEDLRRRLSEEFGEPLPHLLSSIDFERFHLMLTRGGRSENKAQAADLQDWPAAAVLGTIEVASTLPVITPLMLLDEPRQALLIASGIGIAMLAWAGVRVARWNGQSIWLLGVVTPVVGMMLVAVCLIFGG